MYTIRLTLMPTFTEIRGEGAGTHRCERSGLGQPCWVMLSVFKEDGHLP